MPLLPKRCRDNDENLPFAFSPSLGQKNSGFNRFAEANFVSEDRTFRQWGAESKQRSFDLMGVQVNLSVSKGSSQLLHAVRRAPLRQFIGEVFGVVGGAHNRRKGYDTSRFGRVLFGYINAN